MVVDKKVQNITRGLVAYLKKTNQLDIFPTLVREALKKSRSSFDPNLAIVTTPYALSKNELMMVTKELKAKLKRDMRVKNEVNEDLLGGLHIRIGDKVIDMSLKKKLGEMSEQWEE